jgi:Flp pilus assembly protein TadG
MNHKRLPHFGLWVRRARNESGLAAVEFALILPVMVLLWFGGVELTQGLSVDRHLNNLASSIGDLVSRTKIVTHANMDQIFDIAPGAMYPYCDDEAECNAAGLAMRVTAVAIDDDGNATVDWSYPQGMSEAEDEDIVFAKVNDDDIVLPATLRQENTQVIVAQAKYSYHPAIGYVITDDIQLDDIMYFVPRLTNSIQLCESDDPTPTGCEP